MRRFTLVREQDVSGVSGIGIVAEGVMFSDGTCVLRWLSANPSTNVYTGIAAIKTIHLHHGLTSLRWVDPGSPLQPDEP
jgi:hypothetical protein